MDIDADGLLSVWRPPSAQRGGEAVTLHRAADERGVRPVGAPDDDAAQRSPAQALADACTLVHMQRATTLDQAGTARLSKPLW